MLEQWQGEKIHRGKDDVHCLIIEKMSGQEEIGPMIVRAVNTARAADRHAHGESASAYPRHDDES